MAWLAAAAYTFAPFHMVNVYVRGDSLSEFYAFVFYPLILRAIDRVAERPGRRSIALLALAYGGLVLTHNISALIFSAFVLLYVLLKAIKSARHASRFVGNCALGLVGGLLFSAWVWLPALGEAHLVQLDAQTTGYFNYAEHFRSTNLIQPTVGFDYAAGPPRTPFAMGLAQTLGAATGLLVMLMTWRRGEARLRLFALIGVIVSTLMITPLSKPVWDALPLLPLAQFPWRFLSVQALFTSLAIGWLASLGKKDEWTHSRLPPSSKLQAVHTTILGLALAASTLLTLRPEYLPIRADEITPQRIQLYEAFTTNIGTTIRAEYLPRTTIPRPYTSPALIDPAAPPRAISVAGEASARQIERGPISQTWRVAASTEATLAFPTLFFPGWWAAVDGQAAEARPAVDLGYIEVDVPAGEHAVTLTFGHTVVRAAAEIVSLAAALVLVAALLIGLKLHPATMAMRVARAASARRRELVVLALAAVFAGVASRVYSVEARDDDLVMDFESRPWLHHATGAPESALVDEYSFAGALAPGASLALARRPSPSSAEAVRLVTPAWRVFNSPPISVARADAGAYLLDVPATVARGMYLVAIDSGATAVFLKPLFQATPVAPPDSPRWARIAGQIELNGVSLKHDSANRLTVSFDWSALKPIAANYAVSIRLQAAQGGATWVSLDTQPGYGFMPTSAWLPGERQHDVYALELPPDMPRDSLYALDVVWYRVASLNEIGRVRVPGISIAEAHGETRVAPPPRNFEVQSVQHRIGATFGNAIQLIGYDWSQSGERLALTLHWQAIIDIGTDYKYFVHVFDPATERIAAQADAMPGGNAYPTSRWIAGEVVSETIELRPAPGTYRVATGWYDPGSAHRLPALDSQGNPAPGDRVILLLQVVVP